MKFLYHHRTKSRDGQAVHIRELISALRGRGHEVTEWALSPVFGEAADDGAMGSEGGVLGRLAARAPRALYEVAEHGYGPAVAGRLAAAGRELGAEVLYERHALGNTAGIRAARRLGIPLLLEVNAPLALERGAHETLVFRGWAARSERAVLAAADRILCVTAVLADMLAAQGVARSKLVVIPNGVDLSLYPPRTEGADDEVVIGFTGFFRPWHRVEALVDALAEGVLPATARLLLVGDGPSRESIETRAAERGVADRVTVTGAVHRDAVPGHVRRMDVCVQPAATGYASPLKLFEYMGAGAAVVAPDQPNLREILTDDTDALLFPPGDTAALTAALARLAQDGALRRRLGAGARNTIVERGYTWDDNAARVAALAAERCAAWRGAAEVAS